MGDLNLFQFLIQQFYQNDFLQAAVVAAPLAAISFTARNIPVRLWKFVRRCLSMDVQFNSDMADYHYVQQLVSREIVNDKWSRRYHYHAETDYDYDSGEEQTEHIGLTSGYGTHWGTYNGTLVWVERALAEGGANTEKFKEHLNLTFLTRRRSVIESFARMIEHSSGKLKDVPSVPVFINTQGWWRRGTKLPLRPISTVFTQDNKGQKLVEDIRAFEANRDWCLARGLPHRLGVLLMGDPGTGKSSLLHALASELGRSIFYLNPGSIRNDEELISLVSNRGRTWGKALLVIEDFDAAGVQVMRSDDDAVTVGGGPPGAEVKPLSLSAMLNCLDGLIAPDGLVVIATTNHPERLDEALIREGRFDIQLDLGPLGWSEFKGMARLFDQPLQWGNDLEALYRPTPGSKLRALLLRGGIPAVRSHFNDQPSIAA